MPAVGNPQLQTISDKIVLERTASIFYRFVNVLSKSWKKIFPVESHLCKNFDYLCNRNFFLPNFQENQVFRHCAAFSTKKFIWSYGTPFTLKKSFWLGINVFRT